MSAINFAAVKAIQLSAIVARSVKLQRRGSEWLGCCPFHPDRSPSFTVNDAKGFAYCFGCGWHGDAVDFVTAIAGCDVREAVARLGAGEFPKRAPSDREPRSGRAKSTGRARQIWREAGPISGTPAARYLERRGIHMALPPSLRFARLKHPEGGTHPCLVAAVFGGERTLTGVQRIYLTEDGRKAEVEPVKMSLGKIAGSAIRLAPAAGELIVCEGVEDGLSLQQDLGRAVWVAAGASMLPRMEFPLLVRSIVIAADNDDAGECQAAKAEAEFRRRGLAVRIIRPEPAHKDFNQQLQSRLELADGD